MDATKIEVVGLDHAVMFTVRPNMYSHWWFAKNPQGEIAAKFATRSEACAWAVAQVPVVALEDE